MDSLTHREIIVELLAWYSVDDLNKKLYPLNFRMIDRRIRDSMFLGETERIMRKIFADHVQQNAITVPIESIGDHEGSTLLVDTPDGFQVISRFIEKGYRNCLKVKTYYDNSLVASVDHLTETELGWVKHGDIKVNDRILTKIGYEMVNAIGPVEIKKVFDLEVNHVNHRFWTENISSHNSGKSFLLSNIILSAQKLDDAFILAIDTENALDHDYLKRIGVDVSPEKFLGISVVTISDIISIVSDFIRMYQSEYGKYNPAAPRVLIAVDSLDMLLTDAESDHFEKGQQSGDFGQRAKQMKSFLRSMVSRIKALNIAFIGTHQVYPADVLEGEGKWKINNAIRYSASQIVLLTKLRLKEEGEVSGIRMYVETFKSRFAKLGSKVEIHVPYHLGMNPYSGLLALLEHDGVVTKSGAWYNYQFPGDEKPISFQSTKMDAALAQKLLSHPLLVKESKLFESIMETPDNQEQPDKSIKDLPVNSPKKELNETKA